MDLIQSKNLQTPSAVAVTLVALEPKTKNKASVGASKAAWTQVLENRKQPYHRLRRKKSNLKKYKPLTSMTRRRNDLSRHPKTNPSNGSKKVSPRLARKSGWLS